MRLLIQVLPVYVLQFTDSKKAQRALLIRISYPVRPIPGASSLVTIPLVLATLSVSRFDPRLQLVSEEWRLIAQSRKLFVAILCSDLMFSHGVSLLVDLHIRVLEEESTDDSQSSQC